MKSKGVFKIVALRYPDQMVYVSKNNTSVTEDFWMDQYEVTRSQFNEFITSTGYITDADKKNPSFVKTKSGWEQNKGITWHYEIDGEKRKISTGNESVSFVSWNDAVAYCKWKNKRLPSAVEWEYAALGGKYSKGSKYSGGNFLRDIAWYKENTDMKKLHQPGLKIPNELYIYDMNGNVSEWIFDTAEKLNDGQEKKIVKGGSIYSDEASISITANLGEKQNVSYSDIGFRCACSINK
jgi:formylglycine-generating enzyme required for sulfatase activity